jgi:hypothetical protein
VGSPRTLVVTVNGTLVYDRDVTGSDWEAPASVTFPAYIPAGSVKLVLNGTNADGPDLDKISIA